MRRCKASWLESYLEYTREQESPLEFHRWIGLAILSAAIGRRIWIPRIKYTLYPNLFVILVAGSAKCKKSTAIKLGEKVLKGIEKPPATLAQKITPEALIQTLEEAKDEGAASGFICADELSAFMGTDATKSGIIPILISLYDSPKEWIYRTRSRGKEVLANATLTILAGTTKQSLRDSIPPESVGAGFSSRIIFVYQERPRKPILFHNETAEEKLAEANLIKDLNDIRRTIKGPMEFTPEAKKIAKEWYQIEWETIRDEKLNGYFARKHDTMFKVATLLSVSQSSSRIIERRHIEKALAMFEENETNLGAVLESVVTTTVGSETEKIYEIIRRERKIMHSDLLKKCWRFATAADVNIMIRTLIESGEIKESVGRDGRTRYYERS